MTEEIDSRHWDFLRPGTLDNPALTEIIHDARASGVVVETWRTGWVVRREHAIAQGPVEALRVFSERIDQLQTGSTEPWTRRRKHDGLSQAP